MRPARGGSGAAERDSRLTRGAALRRSAFANGNMAASPGGCVVGGNAQYGFPDCYTPAGQATVCTPGLPTNSPSYNCYFGAQAMLNEVRAAARGCARWVPRARRGDADAAAARVRPRAASTSPSRRCPTTPTATTPAGTASAA